MEDIIKMLAEGGLSSNGRVSEVLGIVADQPELFDDLIGAIAHSEPGIRMRASDAVEKITRTQPEYLQPHKRFVLAQVVESSQKEVRWSLAQIVPRLELSPQERSRAAEGLFGLLDDPSKIVQTNALQALVELAWEDDILFPRVKAAVEVLADDSSPAVSDQVDELFLELDDQ